MSPASAVLSITEERLYTARLGERTITGLAVASAWEGLTKYTDRNGAHLIVLDADQRVITASPDLIAQLGAEHHAADLPQIGAQYAGGYFAGVIDVHGERHALIVAGAEGELTGAWHENTTSITGADSRFDGLANTFAMSRAGSKLAQAAQALRIGGHSDWFIPSRDELEAVYRALKATTTRNYADGADGINPSSEPAGEAYTKDFPAQTVVANFRDGGKDALTATWYWSSTQYAANPGYAWGQSFDDGYQGSHPQVLRRARACRPQICHSVIQSFGPGAYALVLPPTPTDAMNTPKNLVTATGNPSPMAAHTEGRRFFVVDPVKLNNAQQHAEQLQAHYDFLTTRQRESGMRIRLCSTGCYSIYDAAGHFIGRTTTPDTWSGVPATQLKTVAARMAFSEELANVCRLADLDFERTGTVAPGTIVAIRTLLGAIGAV